MRDLNKRTIGMMLGVLLLSLSACVAGVTLKSFNQKLVGGYSSVTVINNTAVILLDAKVISSADAQNVRDQTKLAKEGLDLTKTLKGVEAEDKLNATIRVLTALEGYLAEKQKGIK